MNTVDIEPSTQPTVRELWELACPICCRDDYILITVESTVQLFPDGTETVWDTEWHNNSACCCMACTYRGVVKDFKVAEGTL